VFSFLWDMAASTMLRLKAAPNSSRAFTGS
jgi:hypothetical protein